MTDEQQVKVLLRESRDSILAQQCLDEADGGLVSFSATRPVPTHEIRGIYRLRSERNERLGKPIQGLTELMAGLDAAVTAGVIIHSLLTSQNAFAIFTDADRT